MQALQTGRDVLAVGSVMESDMHSCKPMVSVYTLQKVNIDAMLCEAVDAVISPRKITTLGLFRKVLQSRN